MPVRYMGRNDKWFAENMGIGGRAISLPKRENLKSDTSVNQGPTESDTQQFREQMSADSPSEKTEDTNNALG